MFAALNKKTDRPAQSIFPIGDIITAWQDTVNSRNEKSEVAEIESL